MDANGSPNASSIGLRGIGRGELESLPSRFNLGGPCFGFVKANCNWRCPFAGSGCPDFLPPVGGLLRRRGKCFGPERGFKVLVLSNQYAGGCTATITWSAPTISVSFLSSPTIVEGSSVSISVSILRPGWTFLREEGSRTTVHCL